MEFPLLDACLPVYSFIDIDIIMPACTAVFDTFHLLSCDVLSSLISKLNKTTCVLDPFPTKLLMSHLFYIIDIILCIVNLCFSSGVFPTACKSSIMFPRSPQLRCDLSGLSVNVGESQITQSLKVRDLGVTFDQFLNFDDHITAICRSTYFHIRNSGKIRNLLSYNACSTIIHALISCRLDYCNSLLYNVPTFKTDRLQRLQNQCARILTKSQRREHITPVLKSLLTYLCELISRRESSVNMRLGSDQHQLIMPPISKDCSNTFLERSFIYAAPCEWNKLSECIRTSSFDSFRKSVKTMLFTQQYGC